MSPSEASRELFLAARACPRSLSTSLAPSRSPPASSSAFFTSIIPAAVSSRSCLIFSIVVANLLPLLVLSRSRRLGRLGLGVVDLLSLGLTLFGLTLLGLPPVGLLDLGRRAGLRLRGLDGGRVDGGLRFFYLRFLDLRFLDLCRRRVGCGLGSRGGPVRFGGRLIARRLRLGGSVDRRLGNLLGGDPLGGLLRDLGLLDHRRQRAVGD